MPNDSATSRVLDSLLARSAGILHVGVVGSSDGLDRIVTASYRTYVRNTDIMIAAIPLEMAQTNRTIYKGANVFDFAVQGYFSGSGDLQRKNFEYIFKMGPRRASEYAKTLADDMEKQRITAGVDNWLQAVKSLPENDLKGTEVDMQVFDELLDNFVRVRVLFGDGTSESTNLKLSSATVAQWLANYLQ